MISAWASLRSRIQRNNGTIRRQSYRPNYSEAAREGTSVAPHMRSVRIDVRQECQGLEFTRRAEVARAVALEERNNAFARFGSDAIGVHPSVRSFSDRLADSFRDAWFTVM